MFQSWRCQISEATRAFKQGRLEKASRLLCDGDLQQCLPGQRLAAKVSDSLLDRARRCLESGVFLSAWRDLEAARTSGCKADRLRELEKDLVTLTLLKVDEFLAAGELEQASLLLSHPVRRHGCDGRVLEYKDALRRLESAKNLSQHGRFSDAEQELAVASELLPGVKAINHWRQTCREKLTQSRQLTEQLRWALTGDQWSRSLMLADRLLELAPQSRLAQDSRRRALAKAGAQPVTATTLKETGYWLPALPSDQKRPGRSMASCSTKLETHVMNSSQPRFLLWVDAVGGYLVCLGDEVTIGQAVPETHVDIPILADLSRYHAKIRRENEDYLIEPIAPVRLGGKDVHRTSLLVDGDELELGRKVLLRFRRPHPLSATARLEFASRHRTQPWADGILLMAESCLLGPNWNNHVVCRDWTADVVLYRRRDALLCRGSQTLAIDGKSCDGPAQLTYHSQVTGADFSMTLEEI